MSLKYKFSNGIKGLTTSVICVALTACFNSSDNSSPSSNKLSPSPQNTQETMATEDVSFKGEVANGSLSSGQVDVYTIEEGIVNSSPAYSTTTDSEGSFSATINPETPNDLVLVEVTAGQGAMLRCDIEACGNTTTLSGVDENEDGIIGFGEVFSAPEDFKLSAIVSATSLKSDSVVFVTPFTHLVAQRAQEQSAITIGSVNQDADLISQSFGLVSSFVNLQASITAFNSDEINYANSAYSLYTLSFFSYANQNDLTITEAADDIKSKLFSSGGLNQALVLLLLEHSLIQARFLSENNPDLLQLIADIRLVINRYSCVEEIAGDDVDCDAIIEPVSSPEEELAKVKTFVADLKSTVKSFATDGSTPVEEFATRTKTVQTVWESDLKYLLSVLNDVLPPLAQTVSPNTSFCNYCLPETSSDGTKTLKYNGLTITLSPDGFVNVSGEMRDTIVEMDLMLPTLEDWANGHRIEIQAGRLSRGKSDLIFTEGSEIGATYDTAIRFKDLIGSVNRSWSTTPEPTSVNLQANFTIQAEYEIYRSDRITFEGDSLQRSPVEFKGDWSVAQDNSASGGSSLKSRRISHRQQTYAEVNFETSGGQFSFDYAYESEGSFDFLEVYINGSRVLSKSGFHPGFQTYTRNMAPGNYTVRWVYRKDGSVNNYRDAAWIDNVEFPSLILDGNFPSEVISKNIMVGSVGLDVHKVNGSWAATNAQYIPGEISLNVNLVNEFSNLDDDTQVTDQVGVNLTAVIANAAEFVPPRKYDRNMLAVLGNYTVSEDRFEHILGNIKTTVEEYSKHYFSVVTTNLTSGEQISSRIIYSPTRLLEVAAGDAINNSGIGSYYYDQEKGIFIVTLLNASPWGNYPESQFSPEGGQIFGLLTVPYQPNETASQYIEAAVSAEINVDLPDFGRASLSTRFNRDSFTKGDVEFAISKDSNVYTFSSNIDYLPGFLSSEGEVSPVDPKINIRDYQGVEMVLQRREVSGDKQSEELYGEITYNGTVYGTVQRIKGLTAIRYTDGTGETIE